MSPGITILFFWASIALLISGTWLMLYSLTHPPRMTTGRAVARGIPIDPSDIKIDYESESVPLNDGNAELWILAGKQTTGPVMIVVHGWGDSRFGMLAWAPLLTEVSSHVVLFDLAGHGESEGRRSTWGELELDDVNRIVTATHERFPDRNIVLFGQSMGAVISLHVATSFKSVAAVIADSPYRYHKDVIHRTLKLNRLPSWPLLDLAYWLLAKRYPSLRDWDTKRLAPQCPVLVMHGEDDLVAPVDHAKTIADAIAHSEWKCWPKSDHLKAADDHTNDYHQVMAAFIHRNVLANETTNV